MLRGPPQHAWGASCDPAKAAMGTPRVAQRRLAQRRRRRCDCRRPPRRRSSTRRTTAACPPAPRPCSGVHPRRLCAVAPAESRSGSGDRRGWPPPPWPLPAAPAANRPRGRKLVVARRHSQGSEGRVRRGSRAKEDRCRRRRRPARPLRPSPRIRPLRRTRLEPTVGRQRSTAAHPDARFLLLAPVRHFPRAASRSTPPPRLLASSPVRLRRRARPPSATPAVCRGNGPRRCPPPLRKAGRDGERAPEREKEGPPLSRPTPQPLTRPGCAAAPWPPAAPPAPALLVAAAPPRQLEWG